MERNELINLFEKLGKVFGDVAEDLPFSQNGSGVSASGYGDFVSVVQTVKRNNAWFTPENVRKSLGGIASWLTNEQLTNWVSDYPFATQPKRVGLVMAGNIPLVGFHDFLSVLIMGHQAVCKFSSGDNILWPAVLKLMQEIDARVLEHITVTAGKFENIDAIIATGSDNSARYFEHYFGKYPNIIRKNRTSVAVLTGQESDEELQLLSDDIFSYFGLGCRNVSKLLIHEDFNLDRFFTGIFHVGEQLMQHHKYMNNFDYNRAVYLLNKEDVLENGFALLRFTEDLHSPLSVLNCQRYKDKEEVEAFIAEKAEEIQVVIGHDFTAFGQSQQPGLSDYADNINTLDFLKEI